MVASACYSGAFSYRGPDISFKRLSGSAVHIHAFLNMKKINREETLKTLIVLALFFLALFFFSKNHLAIYAGAAMLILGLFENPAARLLASAWLSFSEFLGKISTFILLGIVFYLFLTPLALIWRLINKKEAGHFLRDEEKSLFSARKSFFTKEYFHKTW